MADIEQKQISKGTNIESDLVANNYRLNSINERLEEINAEFRDSFDMLNNFNNNNKKGINQENINSELESQFRLNVEKNKLIEEKNILVETINNLNELKKEKQNKTSEKISAERLRLQKDALEKELTLKKKEEELITEMQILSVKTKDAERAKRDYELAKTKLEEFERLNSQKKTDEKIEKAKKETGETVIKGETKKDIKVLKVATKKDSEQEAQGGLTDEEMKAEAPKESEYIGGDNLVEKVIQYTIKPGDTLMKLSRKYGCDINDLIELNKSTVKNKNLIKPGQIIQIRIIEIMKDN